MQKWVIRAKNSRSVHEKIAGRQTMSRAAFLQEKWLVRHLFLYV